MGSIFFYSRRERRRRRRVEAGVDDLVRVVGETARVLQGARESPPFGVDLVEIAQICVCTQGGVCVSCHHVGMLETTLKLLRSVCFMCSRVCTAEADVDWTLKWGEEI